MRSPRCSLIVPIHNGLEFLEPMLASLRACTPDGLYELILSDDGSGEETRQLLAGQSNWAQVVLSAENKGFAAACNSGATRASGEFLVFLNTDLEFKPGWLEALVTTADEDEKIGAVGCKLVYPDGTIQHGGVFLREDQLDRIPLIASHDHVGKPSNDSEANKRADLLAVTAAAILIRGRAFAEVGGFDEAYFNGYEDVDLCLKLGRAGWRTVYEPACELIHFESKSGAPRFAATKSNQRRFLEKWLGQVRPEVLVTAYCEVEPHPNWRPNEVFSSTETAHAKRVRIVVLWCGNVGSLALTLESVFAARVGLYDSVVAIVDEADVEATSYLKFCEGLDDAFSWRAEKPNQFLSIAMDDATEDFVAFLTAGTVVTQGWLARLSPWLEKPEVGAAGPMLTSSSGAQNGAALFKGGGSFHPNDISHGFARAFRGQGQQVQALDQACLLMRVSDTQQAMQAGAKNLKEIQASLSGRGLCLVAAKDVFVHIDNREGALARAA